MYNVRMKKYVSTFVRRLNRVTNFSKLFGRTFQCFVIGWFFSIEININCCPKKLILSPNFKNI